MASGPASRAVLLVRHGRSSANAAGVLAGRQPGIELDETGRRQADELVQRMAGVEIARLVSSPLDRCRQTLTPLAAERGMSMETDAGLVEVDYGSWTGRRLADLTDEPLWRVVQVHPAAASFPDGESLAAVAGRAVAAVRSLVETTTTAGALVVCAHGDVIKAVLADALGMHLDMFQRIAVGPGSVSAVVYTPHRPFVCRLGDTGSLAGLVPTLPSADPPEPPQGAAAGGESDAVPGGGL